MEQDLGELYKANHRRQQWMLAAAAGIVMICGLAPRNERALFFTELPRTVRALSVAVPPVGYTVIDEDGPVAAFRNYLARPRTGRSGVGGPPDLFPLPPATPFAMADDGLTVPFGGVPGFQPASFDPLGPPVFAGEPGSPAPVGLADVASSGGASSGGTSTGGTSTGGTSTGGTSSGDPTTSTGGPTTSTGGPTTSTGGPTTSTGGPTTSTGGNPPPPNTPVGAVPEPLTWMMMIFGFFAMGSVLRRGVRSVQA